jgi:UDP-2,3-diacylglucosamine hydrolase
MDLTFFSDLHLRGPTDPLYMKFLKALGSAQADSVVVLGGDVFELLVGDRDHWRKKYSEFYEVLGATSTRASRVVWIQGNHDFHLVGLSRSIPRLEVVSESVEISMGDHRFYCAHGDLIDTEDYGYRLMRRVFRSPLGGLAARAFSNETLERLGEGLSRKSQALRESRSHTSRQESFERNRKLFRNFAATLVASGFRGVLLGHSHDLDQMSFRIGDHEGWYANSGFPPIHGTYLRVKGGQVERVAY